MKNFTGTGVALITPFTEQGNIDIEGLRHIVSYVIEGGVDFLVALGTTAETPTLTDEERAQVVEIITSENAGRLPVMVGIGGNCTQTIVRELQTLPWLKKCDAVLSVTPYYNKPSQQGMYEHFKAIAENSPLPVCLYNVPGRTGVNLSGATTVRLANDCPNVMAIKEASGNFEQATEILKGKRQDFIAFSGDDCVVLPLMSMGFEGVISVLANVLPRECSQLVSHVKRGEYAEARELHLRLSEMCRALFAEGNPAGIKAALQAKGVIKHEVLRLPLIPVSRELYGNIRQLVQQF